MSTKSERMKAIHGVKVTCECGIQVARWSMSKHLESKTHQSKISGEIIPRQERFDKQPIEQRREKERERSAKYRNENGDKCRENNREYWHKNKEELCKKIQCECGELSTKSSLNRHRKSKNHNDRLQKQQLND